MLLLRIMLAEPHRDLVATLHTNIGNAIYILSGSKQITSKLQAAPNVLCNDILAQYATALDYNIIVQAHPLTAIAVEYPKSLACTSSLVL